jgi:hypothetical protein
MGAKCLKCGYERTDLDRGDEAICPQCGAVYAKVEARLLRQKQEAALAKRKARVPRAQDRKPARAPVAAPLPAAAQKSRALIKCKDCGGVVSRNAETCPHCGAPVPEPPKLGCGGLLGILLLLGLLSPFLFPTQDELAGVDRAPAPLSAPKEDSPPSRSPEPKISDAECMRDLQCWGDRNGIRAGYPCRRAVERLAKYAHEWTDGWLGSKFPRFRWHDRAAGQLTFLGDSVRFQNGFGAWQNYAYSCDYDPHTDAVLDVSAWPGRLPPLRN